MPPTSSAFDRAEYLRNLAHTLTNGQISDHGKVQHALNEIADWIDLRGGGGLAPGTYQVVVKGPCLWYFDSDGSQGTAVRLDEMADADARRMPIRTLAIARALLGLTFTWVERLIDNPTRPVIPGRDE